MAHPEPPPPSSSRSDNVCEVFTQFLLDHRPRAELWDWLITGMATLLSLVIALGIFEYQSWRADEDKQDQFLTALAGELQANLDSLRSKDRTKLHGRIFGHEQHYIPIAEARLVRLPPLVIESAISSGLFDAYDTLVLTHIARALIVHNAEVEFLLSIRSGEAYADTVRLAQQELEQRQQHIAGLCDELLQHIKSTRSINLPQQRP
jgi:hypothetical protein